MSKQMQLYKMRRIIIYIHGKGGNAEEANHYRSLFPESDVVGFDYADRLVEHQPAAEDAEK